MKLTCAIIDDEPLAVELMESYVRKTPFLELKASFGSGYCCTSDECSDNSCMYYPQK